MLATKLFHPELVSQTELTSDFQVDRDSKLANLMSPAEPEKPLTS